MLTPSVTHSTFITTICCDLNTALGLVAIWKLHSDSLLFTPYAHFSFKYMNNISSVVNYAVLIWGEYLHRIIACLFQETRLVIKVSGSQQVPPTTDVWLNLVHETCRGLNSCTTSANLYIPIYSPDETSTYIRCNYSSTVTSLTPV